MKGSMGNQTTPSHPSEQQMLSSRIALRGAIGVALEKALEDVQNEMVRDEQVETSSHSASHPEFTAEPFQAEPQQLVISSTTLHYIQSCYGTVVANTDWRAAPAATMKGRLDHYNRFQGQWRIVVDKSAEIAPRPPDTAVTNSNGKKNNGNRTKSTHEGLQKIELDEKVQILVFNDL